MIELAGIAPQVGAAFVAGVFMLINSLLTIYVIRMLNDRRDKAEDRPNRDKDIIDVLDIDKGGLPIDHIHEPPGGGE